MTFPRQSDTIIRKDAADSPGSCEFRGERGTTAGAANTPPPRSIGWTNSSRKFKALGYLQRRGIYYRRTKGFWANLVTTQNEQMSRNVFGWDYPAGAEHDPRAPWNEPPECEACDGEGVVTCSDCDGAGMCETCSERGHHQCRFCNGTGRKQSEKESREDYEADMERDDV